MPCRLFVIFRCDLTIFLVFSPSLFWRLKTRIPSRKKTQICKGEKTKIWGSEKAENARATRRKFSPNNEKTQILVLSLSLHKKTYICVFSLFRGQIFAIFCLFVPENLILISFVNCRLFSPQRQKLSSIRHELVTIHCCVSSYQLKTSMNKVVQLTPITFSKWVAPWTSHYFQTHKRTVSFRQIVSMSIWDPICYISV